MSHRFAHMPCSYWLAAIVVVAVGVTTWTARPAMAQDGDDQDTSPFGAIDDTTLGADADAETDGDGDGDQPEPDVAPADQPRQGGGADTPFESNALADTADRAEPDDQGDPAKKDPIAIAREASQPTTWANALARFWKYFGIVGIACVLLLVLTGVAVLRDSTRYRGGGLVWAGAGAVFCIIAAMALTRTLGSLDLSMVAVVLLVIFVLVFALRRQWLVAPLIAVALGAFALGEWNSHRTNQIDVDRSAERQRMLQAQQEMQAEQARRDPGSIAEGRMAVEMSDEDRALLAEAEAQEQQQNEYEAAAGQPSPDEVPLYMRQGKQQRDPSRVMADDERTDGAGFADAQSDLDTVWSLPPADVARADRWDRAMLGLTRWAPWAALFVLIAAYLDRFTRAVGATAPLPISNRLIDGVFGKPLAVRFEGDAAVMGQMLRQMVQKGEAFIYIGPSDPLPEQSELPRWMVLPETGLWSMPKLVMPADEAIERVPFVFESAWFRQLSFAVRTDGPASAWVDKVVDRLKLRRVTKAAARRTLNLVFHASAAPDAAGLRELLRMARPANVRVVVQAAAGTPLSEQLFDETVDAQGHSRIHDRPRAAAPQPAGAGSPQTTTTGPA